MLEINTEKIEKILFFLLGLFTSMALIQIQLGSFSVTYFNFIMYLIVIFELLFKHTFSIKDKKDYIFILYFFCFVISVIINFSNLPNVWGLFNVNSLFNTAILGYLIVFIKKDTLKRMKSSFILGLRLNAWIQLIWGILQYLLYTFTGQSLNQLVFSKSLPLTLGNTANLSMFRLSGLNWEPAYFGFSLIIGYLLVNKWWKKALFILVILLSTSITSLLSLLAVIIAGFIYDNFFKAKRIKRNLNVSEILIGILALSLFIIFIATNWDSVCRVINYTFLRFQNLDSDASSITHTLYYQKLGDILFNKFNLFELFFGNSVSGYAYTLYYGLYSNLISTPWVVENGLVNLLVGKGIIGTFLVYDWFLLCAKDAKKENNRIAFCLIIGVIVGSITYSYFVNWIWIVVLFISLNSYEDDESCNSNNRYMTI